MKKPLIYFVLLVLLFPSLFSQTHPEKLEAQLSKTKGKEKINLLLKLTSAYNRKNAEKALEYGKQALELLKTFPNEKTHAAALNSISNVYMFLGEQETAREHALKSLSIAEKIYDKPGAAAARDSLGEISVIVGELDQAREYYSKNLQTYKDLKDHASLARAINSIGNIYWEKSDYPRALEYYHQALKIYEALNDQWGIGLINHNIGFIYWELKDTEKSLEHYFKALAIREKLNDQRAIAATLDSIGHVYSYLGNYKEALAYLDKALAISEKLVPQYLTSVILNHMGEVHKEQNNDQKALEYFTQSLEICEELNMKSGIAEASINIASIYQRLGRYHEAIQKANKGLDFAQESNVKSMMSDAYQVLSETYEAMGEHQKALGYYKKFKEIKDTTFNENTTRKIAGLQNNFQLERKESQIELLRKDQEQQKMLFKSLILFALLIGLLAFVIYTRYRLKVRITRALEKEIEERKLYEQKLRESEEKFRVLAEKSLVGIWIIQNQVIKYANPTFLKIFGCTLEEMISKNPLELVVEEDRPLVSEHLKERLKGTANTRSLEFKAITKEGDILNLESYGSLTLYEGLPAVLETVIDITDRKRTEKKLIETQSQLAQAEKMAGLGTLVAGVAHEINNPNNYVQSCAFNLEKDLGKLKAFLVELAGDEADDEVLTVFDKKFSALYDQLATLQEGTTRINDIVTDLRTFSRIGETEMVRVHLRDGLQTTANLVKANYKKEVEFVLNFKADPVAECYPGELNQVFMNIMVNGCQAILDKQKSRGENAKGTLSIDTAVEKDHAVIRFEDDGIGMPEEVKKKMFDPFFTTKTVGEGTGLGLSISFSIIKKHRGRIEVSSEEGKGTTIILYIPLEREEAAKS
ncbi:tetratricopeptide repeat protein [Acidobacteriota bacterium]